MLKIIFKKKYPEFALILNQNSIYPDFWAVLILTITKRKFKKQLLKTEGGHR